MSEFSRRDMLSAAAAGGMIAAATSTDGLAEGQPPFGSTPPVLAGAQLPSFRFQLGAVAPKSWGGGWAKEASMPCCFSISTTTGPSGVALANTRISSFRGWPHASSHMPWAFFFQPFF